jgi:predicted phosphodiesterase
MNIMEKNALLLGLLLVCTILVALAGSAHAASWKFAAVGDIPCKNAPKVANAIKQGGSLIVILLGDLGYGSTSKCIKDSFGTIGKPTVGNHDTATDIKKVFGITNEIQTYKFNNIRFLSLNTELSADTQKSRVQGLLNKYKDAADIDFIIPFEHKPFVTNPSAHHKESEAKGFRATFLPMFVAASKIPMVLFGHEHGYQQCEVNDITFITAGTGGRDAYPWGSIMDDNCRNNISGTNGFLEVEVNGLDMVGYFKDLNGGIREETTFQIIK